jgi:HD-GYP domain-containing protein (c-di-GMP phosphodiesterase class II)
VYFTSLLINVGCHSDAYEQAKWFGDDITLKATKFDYEPGSLRESLAMLRQIGAGSPPLHRLRTGLDVARGYHELDAMLAQHAALARTLADDLGLPLEVRAALGGSYERWDGKGWPGELSGEDIPVASRIGQLAEYAEVAHRVGGVGAATALATRRSGTQFDPALVSIVCDQADGLFQGLEGMGTWQTVIAAEPSLTAALTDDQFDAALLAIADFVDLKSPFTLGHSRAVADLAAGAGRELGLEQPDIRTLRRAGLVQGFGRLGVSNAIWDKAGPLGAGEWERVRMHPYFTERMLMQAPALAPLGRIAVQQRERLDGSGYPRGLPGTAISGAARILGAADAYQAMLEPRPYRPARGGDEAAAALRADVRAGLLDPEAVEAVLQAAGHKTRRRREGPAGLTAREVEVLQLLARGLTNRQIAERLGITPKTAGNHIEHIYSKIGASNRAAASLFAVRQGILPEDGAFPP